MSIGTGQFSYREREIISEVFASYVLSPEQDKTAWGEITDRWNKTSGRFYAYTVAHEIAALASR